MTGKILRPARLHDNFAYMKLPKITQPAEKTSLELARECVALLTGHDDWSVQQQPGVDAYEFSRGGESWGESFRITGQLLNAVESDPQDFIQRLTAVLDDAGLMKAPAHEPHRDAENERATEAIRPAPFTVESLSERVNLGRDDFIRVHTQVIRDLITAEIKPYKERILAYSKTIQEMRASLEQRYPLPSSEEMAAMGRSENVELVSAMVAGAGFELLRDDGEGIAMWMQHLPARPAVQVFLQVTPEMLALSPAELFAQIRTQVGVA